MHSTRLFKLLLLVVAIVAVAHASWLDNDRNNARAVVKRQDTSGGESSAGEESSAEAPVSTDANNSADPTDGAGEDEPTPTNDEQPQETSSEAAPETTSAQEQETTSQQEQPSTTAPPTTSSSSSSASVEEQSTSSQEEVSQTTSSASEEAQSTSAEEQETKTSAKPVVTTKVEVVTKTNEDGSKETSTSTSVSTTTPALNADNSDSDGGMSDSTRNTIIGVVVGVGGAILLGAIALISWRIWGRRKRAEENDALMDYDHGRPLENTGMEKTEPPSTAGGSTAPSRSPFQQTLENYHQPTHVNASSNF